MILIYILFLFLFCRFQENSVFERQCAESFHQVLEGEDANEDIISSYNKMFKITDTYTDDMVSNMFLIIFYFSNFKYIQSTLQLTRLLSPLTDIN